MMTNHFEALIYFRGRRRLKETMKFMRILTHKKLLLAESIFFFRLHQVQKILWKIEYLSTTK